MTAFECWTIAGRSPRSEALSNTFSPPTMLYSYRLFDSIGDVDLAAWEKVRSEAGAPIFMDPRFIAAVETSMRPGCRFWYAIVYDGDGRAAACACVTRMTIDLADLADTRVAWVIRRAPGVFSRFRKLKVMICGLPGSPGEKTLAMASANESPCILPLLDRAICDLAEHDGMDVIAFKEFAQHDLEAMKPLLELGYRCIPSLPMHLFKPSFPDFSHYCAALKTRYRQQINRSTRKLKNSGIELSVLTDPEEILRVYTPQVHALYHQMVAKAELNLEVLPIVFFRQLTSRLSGEVELIAYSKDSTIIAFGWCLHASSTYSMLYAGLDYRLNDQFDLYFNLMYAGLDRALRKGVAKIQIGQSASTFKARLGCYSEPLYVFAKGLGPLMSPLIYYGANLLIAEKPALPASDIFKSSVAGGMMDGKSVGNARGGSAG
jgi:predicted N-acyltransferase